MAKSWVLRAPVIVGTVLEASGLLRQLRGVRYVSGLGLRGLSVIIPTRPRRLGLAALVVRFASEEGVLASTPRSSWRLDLGRVWSGQAIALAGPTITVEQTALDRPELLHPPFVCSAVSVLERLIQSL